MEKTRIDKFVRSLAEVQINGLFNPWRDDCEFDARNNGPAQRQARIAAHLDCSKPEFLLLGDVSGYQDCRYTGIPFVAETQILDGLVPRATVARGDRLTRREIPCSTPSAVAIWKTLHDLAIVEKTILFNVVPWHPVGTTGIHSNRSPTRKEVATGRDCLVELLSIHPHMQLIAMGHLAMSALEEMKLPYSVARSPETGVASLFKADMIDIAILQA